jgi:hypothetical protein
MSKPLFINLLSDDPSCSEKICTHFNYLLTRAKKYQGKFVLYFFHFNSKIIQDSCIDRAYTIDHRELMSYSNNECNLQGACIRDVLCNAYNIHIKDSHESFSHVIINIYTSGRDESSETYSWEDVVNLFSELNKQKKFIINIYNLNENIPIGPSDYITDPAWPVAYEMMKSYSKPMTLQKYVCDGKTHKRQKQRIN